MARLSGSSRYQADEESDPEDHSSNLLARIALADLGNEARDRLTAHDKENDRNRSAEVAKINRLRRCNDEDNPEAVDAARNAGALTAWNSIGDVREGDLAPIANGQYHRLATSAKVQEEKLRTGDETGEGLTHNHGARRGTSSIRGRGGPSVNDRGRGISRVIAPLRSTAPANRPLDPAVDQTRQYGYKAGPAYVREGAGVTRGQSVRGGHSAVHGGHGVNPLRSNVVSTSAPAVTRPIPGAGKKGLSSRAANQRKTKTVWPPPGLSSEQIEEVEASIHAANSTPSLSSPSVPGVDSQVIAKPDSAAVPKAQPVANATRSVISQANAVLKKVAASTNAARASRVVENFDAFLSTMPQSLQPRPATIPLPVPVVSRSKPVDAGVVTIPRSELKPQPSTALAVPLDDHTDGLPSPTVLSVASPDPSSAVATPALVGLGISNVQLGQPVVPAATIEEDLLSTDVEEVPKIKAKPLTPVSPIFGDGYVIINGIRYVQESSQSQTADHEEQPAESLVSSESPAQATPELVHENASKTPENVKPVEELTKSGIKTVIAKEVAVELKSESPGSKVLPVPTESSASTFSLHSRSTPMSILGDKVIRPIIKSEVSGGLFTSKYATKPMFPNYHSKKEQLFGPPQVAAWLPQKIEEERHRVVNIPERGPGNFSVKPQAPSNSSGSHGQQQATGAFNAPQFTSPGSILFPNANRRRSDSSDGSEL